MKDSDSRANIVGVYDVCPDGGLGPRRTFARVEDGVPEATPSPMA